MSEGNLYNCTYVESGLKIPKIDWNTALSEKGVFTKESRRMYFEVKNETYGIPFKPK